MKRFPPGYASAAMNAYREHQEVAQPAWLEGKGDRWSDRAKDEAMLWWVRRIVTAGRRNEIFTLTTKGRHTPWDEETYAPGRRPMVRRMKWVQEPVHVPWTPEDETALNRGHVAGIEFLSKVDDWRQRAKPGTEDESTARKA